MTVVVAVFSVGLFALVFGALGVARIAGRALVTLQDSLTVVRNPEFTDDEKQRRLQAGSLRLFAAFGAILMRSLLACAASVGVIWVCDRFGWVQSDAVFGFLARWDVIAVAAVVLVAAGMAAGRWRRMTRECNASGYSRLDRLLHRVAFCSPAVQLTAADIERVVLGPAGSPAAAERPIFITSLPRAGTTMLLEVFHRLPGVATHVYRDMPFLMAPALWARVSGPFQKQSELHERAHKDGVNIGFDSPEAFEEIIWRTFWPEKYTNKRIELWRAGDLKDDAVRFFQEHMQRIADLRCPANDPVRYVSKNNGNVARLDVLRRMFPECRVVVPFRTPFEHAASLLRQHMNFLELHEADPFVRRYMSDLGHYEFGKLHRPIAFPGAESLLHDRDPLALDYWLAYWIVAFEHILAQREKIILMSYEEFCAEPGQCLSRLCSDLDIAGGDAMAAAASIVRPPSTRGAKPGEFDPELSARATRLHEALVGYSARVIGRPA